MRARRGMMREQLCIEGEAGKGGGKGKRAAKKPPIDLFAQLFDPKWQSKAQKFFPWFHLCNNTLLHGPLDIATADPGRRTGYAIGREGEQLYLSGHTVITSDYQRLYYEITQVFRRYPHPIDILVIEGQFGAFKPRSQIDKQGDGGGGGAMAAQVAARCAQVIMDVGIACNIPVIIDGIWPATWQSIHHLGKGVSRNRENLAAATQRMAFAMGLAVEHGELVEDEHGMRMNQDEATAYCMHFWARGRLKQARMAARAMMAGKATGRTAA